MRGVFNCAFVLALLGAVVGCGAGDGGPRGGTVDAVGGGVGGGGQGPQSRPSMRTVIYLPSYNSKLSGWSNQLEFAHVGYINLSFADVDAAGNVSYADQGIPAFVDVAHASGAKVCIAIGGATTITNGGGVYATLLEDANRPAFVDKLVAFVNANNLDCLDVDLEGQGVNQYYEAFVTDLAAKLKPQGKEVTAAVAAWFGDQISDKALATFDFINVMAYDLYYERDTPMQWSSVEAATAEVDKWVARGVPRDRVVYGVPFYGMRWPKLDGGVPETMGYSTLLRLDPAAATEDVLQNQGTIIYLNSRKTIQAKAQIAQTYGGIMAWEISQDAAGDASLLKAIRDAVP